MNKLRKSVILEADLDFKAGTSSYLPNSIDPSLAPPDPSRFYFSSHELALISASDVHNDVRNTIDEHAAAPPALDKKEAHAMEISKALMRTVSGALEQSSENERQKKIGNMQKRSEDEEGSGSAKAQALCPRSLLVPCVFHNISDYSDNEDDDDLPAAGKHATSSETSSADDFRALTSSFSHALFQYLSISASNISSSFYVAMAASVLHEQSKYIPQSDPNPNTPKSSAHTSRQHPNSTGNNNEDDTDDLVHLSPTGAHRGNHAVRIQYVSSITNALYPESANLLKPVVTVDNPFTPTNISPLFQFDRYDARFRRWPAGGQLPPSNASFTNASLFSAADRNDYLAAGVGAAPVCLDDSACFAMLIDDDVKRSERDTHSRNGGSRNGRGPQPPPPCTVSLPSWTVGQFERQPTAGALSARIDTAISNFTSNYRPTNVAVDDNAGDEFSLLIALQIHTFEGSNEDAFISSFTVNFVFTPITGSFLSALKYYCPIKPKSILDVVKATSAMLQSARTEEESSHAYTRPPVSAHSIAPLSTTHPSLAGTNGVLRSKSQRVVLLSPYLAFEENVLEIQRHRLLDKSHVARHGTVHPRYTAFWTPLIDDVLSYGVAALVAVAAGELPKGKEWDDTNSAATTGKPIRGSKATPAAGGLASTNEAPPPMSALNWLNETLRCKRRQVYTAERALVAESELSSLDGHAAGQGGAPLVRFEPQLTVKAQHAAAVTSKLISLSAGVAVTYGWLRDTLFSSAMSGGHVLQSPLAAFNGHNSIINAAPANHRLTRAASSFAVNLQKFRFGQSSYDLRETRPQLSDGDAQGSDIARSAVAPLDFDQNFSDPAAFLETCMSSSILSPSQHSASSPPKLARRAPTAVEKSSQTDGPVHLLAFEPLPYDDGRRLDPLNRTVEHVSAQDQPNVKPAAQDVPRSTNTSASHASKNNNQDEARFAAHTQDDDMSGVVGDASPVPRLPPRTNVNSGDSGGINLLSASREMTITDRELLSMPETHELREGDNRHDLTKPADDSDAPPQRRDTSSSLPLLTSTTDFVPINNGPTAPQAGDEAKMAHYKHVTEEEWTDSGSECATDRSGKHIKEAHHDALGVNHHRKTVPASAAHEPPHHSKKQMPKVPPHQTNVGATASAAPTAAAEKKPSSRNHTPPAAAPANRRATKQTPVVAHPSVSAESTTIGHVAHATPKHRAVSVSPKPKHHAMSNQSASRTDSYAGIATTAAAPEQHNQAKAAAAQAQNDAQEEMLDALFDQIRGLQHTLKEKELEMAQKEAERLAEKKKSDEALEALSKEIAASRRREQEKMSLPQQAAAPAVPTTEVQEIASRSAAPAAKPVVAVPTVVGPIPFTKVERKTAACNTDPMPAPQPLPAQQLPIHNFVAPPRSVSLVDTACNTMTPPDPQVDELLARAAHSVSNSTSNSEEALQLRGIIKNLEQQLDDLTSAQVRLSKSFVAHSGQAEEAQSKLEEKERQVAQLLKTVGHLEARHNILLKRHYEQLSQQATNQAVTAPPAVVEEAPSKLPNQMVRTSTGASGLEEPESGATTPSSSLWFMKKFASTQTETSADDARVVRMQQEQLQQLRKLLAAQEQRTSEKTQFVDDRVDRQRRRDEEAFQQKLSLEAERAESRATQMRQASELEILSLSKQLQDLTVDKMNLVVCLRGVEQARQEEASQFSRTASAVSNNAAPMDGAALIQSNDPQIQQLQRIVNDLRSQLASSNSAKSAQESSITDLQSQLFTMKHVMAMLETELKEERRRNGHPEKGSRRHAAETMDNVNGAAKDDVHTNTAGAQEATKSPARRISTKQAQSANSPFSPGPRPPPTYAPDPATRTADATSAALRKPITASEKRIPPMATAASAAKSMSYYVAQQQHGSEVNALTQDGLVAHAGFERGASSSLQSTVEQFTGDVRIGRDISKRYTMDLQALQQQGAPHLYMSNPKITGDLRQRANPVTNTQVYFHS